LAKTIQVRNVPDAVHRRLQTMAGSAGKSLAAYLRGEIIQLAAVLTADEMRQRLRSRKSVRLTESAATAIRKERESS
jgi:hypothetical protein